MFLVAAEEGSWPVAAAVLHVAHSVLERQRGYGALVTLIKIYFCC